MLLRVLPLLLVAALSGCQTAPKAPPGPMHLEITLEQIDIACVRASMLDTFVKGGLSIRQASDVLFVADRRTEEIGPRLYYGRNLSDRVTATLTPIPRVEGARLTVQHAYAANAGTGREEVHPQPVSPEDQASWAAARGRLERKCGL